MRITERSGHGVIVLRLAGAVTRLDGAYPLGIHLGILARRGYRVVLLDCGGVSHIADAGFDAVCEGRSTLRRLVGDLKLANVSLDVRRLLDTREPLAAGEVCASAVLAGESFDPRWTPVRVTPAGGGATPYGRLTQMVRQPLWRA